VKLTQAQRKVVAEIAPDLADRLKLDERNQRTVLRYRESVGKDGTRFPGFTEYRLMDADRR
jgi:hypothetical protein